MNIEKARFRDYYFKLKTNVVPKTYFRLDKYVAGDFRIHVMPGLTAIQVVFLREHNRIAKILARMNPSWCDEDIYQEARKIVIGMYQHITFAHWLPRVVGPMVAMRMGLMPSANGHNNVYDPNVDATISNVFGVSAFRFGHTLLQNTVLYMKEQGHQVRNEMAFNRPGMIFQDAAQVLTWLLVSVFRVRI